MNLSLDHFLKLTKTTISCEVLESAYVNASEQPTIQSLAHASFSFMRYPQMNLNLSGRLRANQ